jgi:hypothetical protein
MSNGIPPIGSGDYYAQPTSIRRAQPSGAAAAPFSMAKNGVPSTPPAEVLAALDGAARVHQELSSRGLSVSFDVQPEGDVHVSVVDSTGNVVHQLSPARALDVLGSIQGLQQLA